MFFILSKILGYLLSPMLWVGILLVWAFLLKNPRKSRRLYLLAIALFFLLGNLFLAGECMRAWEYPTTPDKKLQTVYEAGIVLGGGMVQEDKENKRLIFRHNTDRFFQAIDLYHKGRIKKILLSAGSGDLYRRDAAEGILLKRYLIGIGISPADILLDSLSDNTYQNAVNSARLIQEHLPGGKCLLITSSFHMRRAMGCFRKQQVACDPFPTNKNTGKRHFSVDQLIIPSIAGFHFYQSLLHEMIGYGTYKIMGYL